MGSDSSHIVEAIRQGACEHLLGIVLDQDGFRQSLPNMDTPTLLGNFITFQALLDILAAQSPNATDLALPTFSELLGLCQAEAVRRGHILHQGEDASGAVVARLVAERMLGRPLPDVSPIPFARN